MNANPLTRFIFGVKTTDSIVRHEVVKKDVDCIIAEVDRDGKCGGGLGLWVSVRVSIWGWGVGTNTTGKSR